MNRCERCLPNYISENLLCRNKIQQSNGTGVEKLSSESCPSEPLQEETYELPSQPDIPLWTNVVHPLSSLCPNMSYSGDENTCITEQNSHYSNSNAEDSTINF